MPVLIAQVSVIIVALIHALISISEIFLWRKPAVHERIGFNQVDADKAAPIVANVGVYNGFIAAGLIWGLLTSTNAVTIQLFFLSCIFVAGVFGAVTLKWTTLVLQTLPSLVALVAVWYVNYLM
jgi:putative membrane protein